MARVNYREALQRFTHIDARFVACEVGLPEKDGFFTVELYPWWEHPLYIKARDGEADWRIKADEDAYQPVTVYPHRIRQILLSRDEEVTDWDFTQDHPLLWRYEASHEITCNAPLSLDQWMQISEAVSEKLTGYSRQVNFAEYAPPVKVARWGKSGSFSLGHFPRPLFLVTREVLIEQDISHYAADQPGPRELPVLFLIDESDYIIADNFEIDVPEFIHKPEWFQPRSDPTQTEE